MLNSIGKIFIFYFAEDIPILDYFFNVILTFDTLFYSIVSLGQVALLKKS